jgi:uncharacterized phage protein (TIGR02220 family)
VAERRMFAKTIIDSDAFLDMPISARLLYYDLAMRADDDGFINSPKKIMKFIGATNDDMNILILRKFIIPFDNGVVVIKHWRIHNYIRKDTYNETSYKEEKAMLELDENKAYRLSSQLSVDGSSTQVRLGKDSIGKDSIDNNIVEFAEEIKEIVDYLNLVAGTNYKYKTKNTQKHINARLAEGYEVEDFKTVIDKKSNEWRGTEMEKYLCPETLFGTKFEKYLNQNIVTSSKQTSSSTIDFVDMWRNA